ncbi:MAG: hypothetical protein ACKVIY_00260 [Acidimicrobiales bacterium]|jgi:hypothetical protein
MSHVIATQLIPSDPAAFRASISEMIRPKLEALGAHYVVANESIAGGSQMGVFTMGSRWASVDAGFAALDKFYADPEVIATLTATPVQPVGRMAGVVEAERGNPSGAYTVAFSSTLENFDRGQSEEFYDIVSSVMTGAGVNGMRMIRWIAAGPLSGSWAALFYTDSLDAYMAGIAALYATPEATSLMAQWGMRPLSRTISISH